MWKRNSDFRIFHREWKEKERQRFDHPKPYKKVGRKSREIKPLRTVKNI